MPWWMSFCIPQGGEPVGQILFCSFWLQPVCIIAVALFSLLPIILLTRENSSLWSGRASVRSA